MGLIPRPQNSEDDDYFDAVILLLTEFRDIDVDVVKRLFGVNGPVDIERLSPDRIMVGSPGRFAFIVWSANYPYGPGAKEEFAQTIKEVRLRDAYLAHTAFISIYSEDLPPQYREATGEFISLTASMLYDESVVAIWDAGGGPLSLPTGEVLKGLARHDRSPFRERTWDGIANVDMETLKSATQEARRRFPEFVAAFNAASDRFAFIVKMHFEHAGHHEHIWIRPSSIGSDSLTGALLNEPHYLAGLHEYSIVTVSLSELSDWGYPGDGEMIGLFTEGTVRKNLR